MVIMMLNMTMMMIKMVMMMSMTAIMMITMMWGGHVSREEMKSWRIWCDFDDDEYEYDDDYDDEYDDYGDDDDDCLTFASLVMLSNSGSSKS